MEISFEKETLIPPASKIIFHFAQLATNMMGTSRNERTKKNQSTCLKTVTSSAPFRNLARNIKKHILTSILKAVLFQFLFTKIHIPWDSSFITVQYVSSSIPGSSTMLNYEIVFPRIFFIVFRNNNCHLHVLPPVLFLLIQAENSV